MENEPVVEVLEQDTGDASTLLMTELSAPIELTEQLTTVSESCIVEDQDQELSTQQDDEEQSEEVEHFATAICTALDSVDGIKGFDLMNHDTLELSTFSSEESEINVNDGLEIEKSTILENISPNANEIDTCSFGNFTSTDGDDTEYCGSNSVAAASSSACSNSYSVVLNSLLASDGANILENVFARIGDIEDTSSAFHPAQWCSCGSLAELPDLNGNAGVDASKPSDLCETAVHLPGCKYLDHLNQMSVAVSGDFSDQSVTDEYQIGSCNTDNDCDDVVNENLDTSFHSKKCDESEVECQFELSQIVDSRDASSQKMADDPKFDCTKPECSEVECQFEISDIDSSFEEIPPKYDCDSELELLEKPSFNPEINRYELDFAENDEHGSISPGKLGTIKVDELTVSVESLLCDDNIDEKLLHNDDSCLGETDSHSPSEKHVEVYSASPDIEQVGISCGFATIGSVLFEKCKFRKHDAEVCESNKNISVALVETEVESIEPSLSVASDSIENLSSLSCEFKSSDTEKDQRHRSYPPPSLPLNSSFTPAHSSSLDDVSRIPVVFHNNYKLFRKNEARLGNFDSYSNPCILEEIDENVPHTHSSSTAYTSAAPRDVVPCYKGISKDEIVATTSAPCSPIPQTISSICSGDKRKREHNSVTRRRVSFPEDEKRLITSYLEPVDPWQRMTSSVTSEEVMSAYITACHSHNCTPIPAVVNQITALPLQIPGRVESFSLRGCKLDVSQCECLEEILKRVQFINIDLENCGLTDDSLIPLIDMIEFYDSATHINISCNNHIELRGWQTISRMLKKSQSMQCLDARGTTPNESCMQALGKALRLGTRLHTLHLENCNLTGRLLAILAAALKLNDTLVKLYLADNRLGSTDCIQLGNLIRSNLSLKLLDLRNNNLQDTGCEHVCEGIAEQSKEISQSVSPEKSILGNKRFGLNSLVLWNNHMTVTCSRHIAAMIQATNSLETLNLGRNSITSDGMIRMKDALLRNTSLKRLYLHATKIGDEGAVALAEFIAVSKNIQRVDLRDNSIKVAGLMALAHSLRHNTSVVQMDLDSNPRAEQLPDLAEKHVNLVVEIKEYASRNMTQLHLSAQEKEHEGDDYSLDPDFRKLSLSSEIAEGGHVTLEITSPLTISSPLPCTASYNLKTDEPRKYRSPAPSPSESPLPSPSLSPLPSPSKNRFKVSKVSISTSSSGSVIVTQNPIFSDDSQSTQPSSATTQISHINNPPHLSSSASSTGLVLSTTSRPISVFNQPAARNRFLSGSGRFTVTRVNDSSLASLPNMKAKSSSLPQISKPILELSAALAAAPDSPKIVISSPVKIERVSSLEETKTKSLLGDIEIPSEDTGVVQTSRETETKNYPKAMKSESAESDDVFLEQTLQSSTTLKREEKSCFSSGGLSPNITLRRELTDSGFLEEPNTESEPIANSLLNPGRVRDSDRDSLLSNNSDPGGLSPLFPPAVDSKATSPTLSQTSNSSIGSCDSALSAGVVQLAPVVLKTAFAHIAPGKAPLAAMENSSSFDTDSEDSELTTQSQSSDSTHSDEVRIVSADQLPKPMLAWVSAPCSNNSERPDPASAALANERVLSIDGLVVPE